MRMPERPSPACGSYSTKPLPVSVPPSLGAWVRLPLCPRMRVLLPSPPLKNSSVRSSRVPCSLARRRPSRRSTPSSRERMLNWSALSTPLHCGALRVPESVTSAFRLPLTRHPGGANKAHRPMLGMLALRVPDRGAVSGQARPAAVWRNWLRTSACSWPARSEFQVSCVRTSLPWAPICRRRSCRRVRMPRLVSSARDCIWPESGLTSLAPLLRTTVTGAASLSSTDRRMSPLARSSTTSARSARPVLSISQCPWTTRSPPMPAAASRGCCGLGLSASTQARGRPSSRPWLCRPQLPLPAWRSSTGDQVRWAFWAPALAGAVTTRRPSLAWMRVVRTGLPVVRWLALSGAASWARQVASALPVGLQRTDRAWMRACQSIGAAPWACSSPAVSVVSSDRVWVPDCSWASVCSCRFSGVPDRLSCNCWSRLAVPCSGV